MRIIGGGSGSGLTWMRGAMVLGLSTALLLCAVALAGASGTWVIQAVTDNTTQEFEPQMSGDRVAWVGPSGWNLEVFTWKAGDTEPTRVTETAAHENSVQVSGDRLVWCGRDGTDSDIYTWQVGDPSPTRVTDNTIDDYGPQVSGDRIVWCAWDGTDLEVYAWRAGDAAPTQITDNSTHDSYQQIFGDRIVWSGYDSTGDSEIFTWVAGDTSPTQVTDNSTQDTSPQVFGDRIAWSGFDGADYEIYVWTAGDSAPTRITDSPENDYDPQVSDDRVAWWSQNGVQLEVHTWKVGDVAPLTLTDSASLSGHHPRVSGERVVWWSHIDRYFEIYTWKAGDAEPTKLAISDPIPASEAMSEASYNPQVSGDRVAWSAISGADREIYTAVLARPDCVVSPGSVMFGDVEVGKSTSTLVTLQNTGNGDLEVSWTLDSASGALGVGTAQTSVVLSPGASFDVPITCTPTAAGTLSGALTLSTNVEGKESIAVPIAANAVRIELPPAQMAQETITFYGTAVAAGSLSGAGPGSSAATRAKAFGNMLEAASDMIARGDYEEAKAQLGAIAAKCDGRDTPPDFITGAARAELEAEIRELIARL